MMYTKTRNIVLNRNDVRSVLMAITSVKCGFIRELRDNATDNDRRITAKESLEKWEKLHKNIKEQLETQDNDSENGKNSNCVEIMYLEKCNLELTMKIEELETQLHQYKALFADIEKNMTTSLYETLLGVTE